MKTTTHQRGARWTRTRHAMALFATAAVFLTGFTSTAQATPTPAPITVEAPKASSAPSVPTEEQVTASLEAQAITCTPTSSAAAAHKKYPCRWKTERFGTNKHTPDLRARQRTIWQMTAEGREAIVVQDTLFEHKKASIWVKSKIATHYDARLYDCVYKKKPDGSYFRDNKGRKLEFCSLGFHTGGKPINPDKAYGVIVGFSATTYKSKDLITSWLLLVLKRKHLVDGKLVPYTIRARGRDTDRQIAITTKELKD